MRNKIMKLTATVAIMLMSFGLFAGTNPPNPPSPNNGNAPSGGGTVGGSAPIDGGVSILLLLGAAYGSKKMFKNYKVHEKEKI